MISKEEIDNLRQYLKCKGVASLYNSDWYTINGLEVSIDEGTVYIYLVHDKWLIACTKSMPNSSSNPHRIIVLNFDGLMRLINGGERPIIT